MFNRRQFAIQASAALIAAGSFGRQTFAQAWPNRTVRLIVPNPAGGPVDIVSRVLTHRLSEIWGQQVVVENKPGAGSNIGAETAARSAPDGYTLYMASFSHGVSRFLYPSLGYDPVASFDPITLVSLQPCMMVVPTSSPARTVAEFIAYAKVNKGKINFGSTGVGTAPYMSAELLRRMAGIEITHVPYRTVSITDLLAGRLDLGFPLPALGLAAMREGKARALAVTGPTRLPSAPELPTMAEAGLPGFRVESWFGLLVPAQTPRDIVAKIHFDTVAVLHDPAVKARLDKLGMSPVGSTPQELALHIRAEMEQWGPVIADAKIQING
jgi:tripartite-type tricarboxylate transporter receptor subunit TctC